MGGIIKRGYLTPSQLKGIELIIEGTFIKPDKAVKVRDLALACQVSEKTVRRWYNDEKFMRELNAGLTAGRLWLRPKAWRARVSHYQVAC